MEKSKKHVKKKREEKRPVITFVKRNLTDTMLGKQMSKYQNMC